MMVGKHKTSVVNMLGLAPNPGSQWINVNNIYIASAIILFKYDSN